MIIPSLIISGIGGLVSGVAAVYVANPYYLILVGRFLQGVGAAGASPIVMPLVGDMYQDQQEVRKGNVLAIPHIGSASVETREEMVQVTITNIINGLTNKELVYEVPNS